METRDNLGRWPGTAKQILCAVRSLLEVEPRGHWVLAVYWHNDASRLCQGKSAKPGIQGKGVCASWSE